MKLNKIDKQQHKRKPGPVVEKHTHQVGKGEGSKNRYGLFSKKAVGNFRDEIDDLAAEALAEIRAERDGAAALDQYFDADLGDYDESSVEPEAELDVTTAPPPTPTAAQTTPVVEAVAEVERHIPAEPNDEAGTGRSLSLFLA